MVDNMIGASLATAPAFVLAAPVALILAMTILVNSRYLLMGAALAPHIRHLPKRVVYPALFVMVDESWALSLADAQRRRREDASISLSLTYYVTIGILLWIPWFTFATIGAILGPIIGDVQRFGLDMAIPAIFLVLVRGMWTSVRAAWPWLVSLIVAAGTHLLIPGHWYVPVGACAGLGAAWLRARTPK